jgi:hypothetical protein
MSRVIHQLTIVIAVVLANSVVAQSSDVVLHLVYKVTGEKRAFEVNRHETDVVSLFK